MPALPEDLVSTRRLIYSTLCAWPVFSTKNTPIKGVARRFTWYLSVCFRNLFPMSQVRVLSVAGLCFWAELRRKSWAQSVKRRRSGFFCRPATVLRPTDKFGFIGVKHRSAAGPSPGKCQTPTKLRKTPKNIRRYKNNHLSLLQINC